jgi:uncharacterized protein
MNDAATADGFSELPDDTDLVIAPVQTAERLPALDFIRGIAVMGILAANIVAFGQPFDAYMYPAAFLTDTGDPDGWMWVAQFVLIDGKMRGLFTLLFGAGLYLFMERAWARGATRKLQAWRLIILIAFGLIHFYLIWPGDILFYYGVYGLVLLACMKWEAATQMRVGLFGYGLGVLFYAVVMSLPWLIMDTGFGQMEGMEEGRANLQTGMEDAFAMSARMTELIRSGDYGGVIALRISEFAGQQTSSIFLFFLETVPIMLIGMALYRMGFFSGAFDAAKMKKWGWIGMIVGAMGYLVAALAAKAGGLTYYGTLAAFVGWTPLSQLPTVLGLAALLVVYAPSATGWLGERVRAAGRAAFTNYLGTSVVMMFVFHGWGLGLFGELNRPQLYGVVLLTCALMLAWSKPWLDRFGYGPLEWLWRCLTYRTVFSLRR